MTISKEAKQEYDRQRYLAKGVLGDVRRFVMKPQLGTSNLSAHRESTHTLEHAAILKELRRLRLR